MDVIRSCYVGKMRFAVGGPPVQVQWYRVDPSAPVYPFPHAFGSLDLEDDKEPCDIGEFRPPRGTWANGQRGARFTGQRAIIGNVEDFQGPSLPVSRYAANTIAFEPCNDACGDCDSETDVPPGMPYQYDAACGGLRWIGFGCPVPLLDGTSSDLPECALPGCSYPVKLKLTIPPMSGCPVLDGLVMDFNFDFTTLHWTGTASTTGGKILKLEMDCSILGQPQLTGTWTTHGELWDNVTHTPPVLAFGDGPTWPLPLLFTQTIWQFEGSECGGNVDFVVDLP